jgi:hypothetical protein
MAAILWWTPRRTAAAVRLVKSGRTLDDVATMISRRFRRKITARAVRAVCRQRGVTTARGAARSNVRCGEEKP